MSLASLASLLPPLGKTNAFWLTRFQALSTGDSRRGGVPDLLRRRAVDRRADAELLRRHDDLHGLDARELQGRQLPGRRRRCTGHVCGNTLVADVPLSAFGAPVTGPVLYNVTGLSGGRNADDDLYADVDATPSFDYVLGSATGGASC